MYTLWHFLAPPDSPKVGNVFPYQWKLLGHLFSLKVEMFFHMSRKLPSHFWPNQEQYPRIA